MATIEELQKKKDELMAKRRADDFDPSSEAGKKIDDEYDQVVKDLALAEGGAGERKAYEERFLAKAAQLSKRVCKDNKWGKVEVDRLNEKLMEINATQYGDRGIPIEDLEQHVNSLEKDLQKEIKEEKKAGKKDDKKAAADKDKDGDETDPADEDGEVTGENNPSPDDLGDPPNNQGGDMKDDENVRSFAAAASPQAVLNNNSADRPVGDDEVGEKVASVVRLAAGVNPADMKADKTLPGGGL